MAAIPTPVCVFDTPAIDFHLPDTEGKLWTLADCRGPTGLLVMFISNHCPYVKAILADLVNDTRELKKLGVQSVAIMANDVDDYPEDAPEKMQQVAQTYQFPFPYLYDATQAVAKAYGAVCTPDFFGYNSDLKLQYRGRFDNREQLKQSASQTQHELLLAMQQIAEMRQGPQHQVPSIGCSIKWKRNGN